MTRRDVLAMGAGVGLMGFSGLSLGEGGEAKVKVPRALKSGSKVALIAPASGTGEGNEFGPALERIRGWGFEPVLGPHAGNRLAYLAGTDEERAADVLWAFEDDSVDGVIALRGGYGCARILDRLDFRKIGRSAKVFMGYSDLTALLVAVTQETGMVTFHGPVGTSSDSDFATRWMRWAIVEGGSGALGLPVTDEPSFALRTVVGGVGEGRLLGGNLSILASLCGTKWQIQGKGSVIFLEEIEEAPYRVDRMLTQMILAGCFDGCKGVMVGQFTGCDEQAPDSVWKVADVVLDRLGGLGVPVLAGCPIGHVKEKWTLPVGGRVRFDADKKSVDLLGPTVLV